MIREAKSDQGYLDTVLNAFATIAFDLSLSIVLAFLLNHSPEYTMATASGVTEFLIELYFFPGLKSFGLLNKIGLVMVIVGQIARTLAMFSAKSNFSHHVEYYKEEHHVLVTEGIYR